MARSPCAEALDRETKDEYTLTVQASDSNGETCDGNGWTVTVVDAACSGGVAAPDPDDNPGLVGDCQVLMGAMDTLIGTGTTTLNWDYRRGHDHLERGDRGRYAEPGHGAQPEGPKGWRGAYRRPWGTCPVCKI